MPNKNSHFQSVFSEKMHAKKRNNAQEINAHKKGMSCTDARTCIGEDVIDDIVGVLGARG